MRRLLLLGAIFLGLSGVAQARTFSAGHALLRAGAQFAKVADIAQPTCPVGVPVQMIAVINQSGVRPIALDRFENAMVAQSLQVRAAWGTPCVQFGPVGWYLYLEPNVTGFGGHWAPGSSDPDPWFPMAICARRPDPAQACAQTAVSNDAGPWTINASHELVEMIVDPSGQGVEVCDPVERYPYTVRGISVADFITPTGRPFS